MFHDRTPPSTPGRPTHRRTGALRLAVALVTGVLALGGCGVRLETPPPAEPSPDAIEQVRGRTVDDALELATAATALSAAAGDENVRAVLDDVAAFSSRHAEELGGVYDSGLPDATPSATPTATPSAVTDVTTLLTDLVDDASQAARDADAVPDPALARLVASIGVARDALADRLAAATGQARPEATADAGQDDATAEPTSAAPEPDSTTTPAPHSAAALALAHDEAAWTFTVLAARTGDDRRAALLAEAERHRAASDAWARTAGVVGRPTDPRRSAYALPAALDDPAVADALPRTLEQAVADASANAVAGADAGDRADALTSLRTATAAASAWGAAAVAFPGIPDLAAVPAG